MPRLVVSQKRRPNLAVVGTAVGRLAADEAEGLCGHVAAEILTGDPATANALAAGDNVDALVLAGAVGRGAEDEVGGLDVAVMVQDGVPA